MKKTGNKKIEYKVNKRNIELEFQKALALEVVKDFCMENNYSIENLSKGLFYFSHNECMFVYKSDVVSNGSLNDTETQPKSFLSITHIDQKLEIKETECAKLMKNIEEAKIRRTGNEKIEYEVNKQKIESEFQKALALEVVKDFCIENNYSIEKLSKELFYFSYDHCMFAHKSDVVPNGLLNDMETQPKVFLSITHIDQKLKIKETEYTKKYIGN